MRISKVGFDTLQNAIGRVKTNVDAWRGKKIPGNNFFRFVGPNTSIKFHGQGLGDLMIIRQFGRGFENYLSENSDPGLGDLVISCGGYKSAFEPDEGDINLFWWWSFGPKDNEPSAFLDYYLEEVSIEPDIILCPSNRCLKEAEQRGFETVFLPLGTQSFRPLGNERSGKGYAGSTNHKQSEKEQKVLGPFADDSDFEWVSDFVTPTQLNLWYNTQLITFGLTKEGQRKWGMVNNRVFETLASGTPLVMEEHPTVDDILGFEYPYQTGSREETIDLVKTIVSNPEQTINEFAAYAEKVRNKHSYTQRVKTLFDEL